MLTVKRFIFNPIQENTYVVYNTKDACAIIDPGCYFPEEKQSLAHWFKEHHLHPNLLLNTHCHLDHVFGNKWVAEHYNLELQIGRKNCGPLISLPNQASGGVCPLKIIQAILSF
jgi:glyoxylase-like metal-dependent hydrolase (beta-lactamase superfamily II)